MGTIFRNVLIGIIVTGWLTAGQASAGVLLYTNSASFDAASTRSVSSDFEGLTSTSLHGDPLIVDGVSYQSTNGVYVCVVCVGYPFDSAVLGTVVGDPLTIDVSGLGFDVTAIGGIFGDLDSGPSSATIYAYGAGNALLASFAVTVLDMGAGSAHSFFGFTTTGGDVITRLVFDMTGPYESVDNMQFGTVSPTPLPAALPLFLTMLGGMGLLKWRRGKRQAA